ncbi:MAG: ABC transporter substrate-binding protein [Pseudolabrys sp.]
MPAKARARCQDLRVKIVYDKSFPPGTTDFSPIVRALQASNADLVIVCSYPLSSVGIALAGQRDELQAETDRRRDGRSAGPLCSS